MGRICGADYVAQICIRENIAGTLTVPKNSACLFVKNPSTHDTGRRASILFEKGQYRVLSIVIYRSIE